MDEQELQHLLRSKGMDHFKSMCYAYARHFRYVCILDSCTQRSGVHPGSYELLAAFGSEALVTELDAVKRGALEGDWHFGAVSYDIKNAFEDLSSSNPAYIACPDLAFFRPSILISIDHSGMLKLERGSVDDRFTQGSTGNDTKGLRRTNRIDRQGYLQRIQDIKELILGGDVYELNYTVEHTFEFECFDPIRFHQHLLARSPVPMASYFHWEDLSLCGASMERYLAKSGTRLISQPIKGTIRKGKDKQEDDALMLALYHSEKDRAENVMIVDLVRNDLAKLCDTGSVRVDELFGIYSYLQLHQMISTVSGNWPGSGLYPLLEASFPMGSMTGTPKIAAMERIDALEDHRRGWYSGCLGYVAPNGDLDLNVVIRSVICDRKNRRLSYSAGGAITIDSVPESEWLECKLKTKAIDGILLEQA